MQRIDDYLHNANNLHDLFKDHWKKKLDFSTLNLQGKTNENEEFRKHITSQFSLIDNFFHKLKEEINEILDKKHREMKDELPEILGCFEKSLATLNHKIIQCNKFPCFQVAEQEILSRGKVSRELRKIKEHKDLKSLLKNIKEKMSILIEAEKNLTQSRLDTKMTEFHNFLTKFRELNRPSLPEPLLKTIQEGHRILDCIDPTGHIQKTLEQIQLTQKTDIGHCKETLKRFTEDIHGISVKKQNSIDDANIRRVNRKSSYDLDTFSLRSCKSFLTNMSFPSHESLDICESLEDITSDSKPSTLDITIPDYFSSVVENPFLYHFVERTNTLLYFEIPNTIKDHESSEWKFKEIHLEGFEIPSGCASIVTPEGRLFLCGGEFRNGTRNEYCGDMIEIEPLTRNIIQRGSMIMKRKNHGICYAEGYIYVIGGYNNGYLRSCERYHVETDRWSEIEDFNSPGMCSMSICAFNNKYLYKFGGEIEGLKSSNCIERYNIVKDKWETIHLKPRKKSEFCLGVNPGCIQINNNQLYVFGGLSELNFHNTNFILQIDIDREGKPTEEILAVNQVNVPIKDNYKPKSTIMIYKNLVFAQTSKKRKLLTFDGNQWVVLNENYMKSTVK